MAWVVWFTGLPGCGKTTIAQRVKAILSGDGIFVKVLQLDEIRKVITPDPTYTDEERDVVYASIAYMAKLLAESGINVIIDATANRRRYRDLARGLVPDFAEVYIRAPLDVCIARESRRRAEFAPKDIYKKAATKGATVPGVNIAYEEPLAPEISVDSAVMSSDQSAQYIADKIIKLFRKD
ncbi:MAG: adenylyl-sulfate kinase [Methanotrichaceae archaeon]